MKELKLKRWGVLLSSVILLAACGQGQGNEANESDTSSQATAEATSASDIATASSDEGSEVDPVYGEENGLDLIDYRMKNQKLHRSQFAMNLTESQQIY